MKLFIISTPSKLRRTRHLWSEMGKLTTVRHQILGENGLADLKQVADQVDFTGYDRVIVDHNLRRMGKEYKQLGRIPNLVIFDFDFCTNYLPGSECRGKLESILKSLPAHRIVVSSTFIRDDLQAKGYDAVYSPKAHDGFYVHHLEGPRDIELGFIGRSKHWAYDLRRDMLKRLQGELGLQVLRTEENASYNRELNRIRIFVSPDLGYHEAMIKNFEAMAAGCVLVAPRLPIGECEYLGWVDFETVVLYDTFEEAAAKIKRLRSEPDLVERIAKAGRERAASQHRWEVRAPALLENLRAPLKTPPPLHWKDRWNLLTIR